MTANHKVQKTPRILTPAQLNNLKHYRYSGVDRSFLSRYILNPFWNWLVTLFPLWMAPNLITLIGLSFMISATLSSFFFPSPITAPPFIFLYISFCISTYLNMDSIDGKQARRTGTSSPLGELFDHGCDAINMMLMAVLIPFIFNLDLNHVTLLMALFGYAAFYASTWEEYHTGTLYLDYISGPVEGAWSVVFSSAVSFCFGPRIWDTKITDNFMVKDIVPVVFILGSISTIITSFRHAHNTNKVTLSNLLKQWIPVTLYFFSCALLIFSTPISLAKWFIFLTGFPACFRISSTIIAYVTKSPLRTCSFYPLEYIPIAILLLNYAVSNDIWAHCFKLSVILSLSVYLSTMLQIISDICNHLDIYCLSIKSKRNRKE